MDYIDQLMNYDPSSDPLLVAYANWAKGKPLPSLPSELLQGKQKSADPWDFGLLSSNYMRRDAFINRFGFCVPQPALIDFLVSNGPVLEVGAGRGFVGKLVALQGGDIRITDIASDAPDVERVSAEEAIQGDQGKSLIFCAWPSLNGDWLGDAVDHMKPGQRLLYIGEGPGGATASDTFFSKIGSSLIKEKLPNGAEFNFRFHGIHDTAQLYRRA